MAQIYEIIDTFGNPNKSNWKRLINSSLRNSEVPILIKNFITSDKYIFSNPDNIRGKIIEKILDDSNLMETINIRKKFWIDNRIKKYGSDCLMKLKDVNPDILVDEIIVIPKKDKINNNSLEEKNSTNNDNFSPSESIVKTEDNDNDNIDSTGNVSTNTEENNIENIIEEKSPSESISSVEKEEEKEELDESIQFKDSEFKFDEIIYNGLNDLMNNIDSDISREIVVKTLSGKINKNYKKKYKEILSKLFIFKDNEWVSVI